MAPITIRPATTGDASALAADRVAMFGDAGPSISTEQAEILLTETALAVSLGIEAATALAWIAESEDGARLGSTVTCLVQRLPTPDNRTGRESFVAQMYVVPDARGRGVGRRLLEATVAESRRIGLAVIRLRSSEAGRPLYLRAGFRALPDFMQLPLGAPDAF